VVSPAPRSGLEQTKDGDPTPVVPAGTAAAECPEEAEPPAWEAPAAAQIIGFPKEHHHHRAADGHGCLGLRPGSVGTYVCLLL